MLQSQLFCKTKKEAPKEAETLSHQLLTRADFIEQIASGIYAFLPLGLRVQDKIARIVREEMENIGAQKLSLPSLQPKSLWERTGRWQTMDPPLFKLKDRHQKELALASTHEDVVTYMVGKRIKTFKDFPLALFQIQTKFRNELRSTGGLLRTREFLMKDLYSFHPNQKDFEDYYELIKKVYQNIFKRCGLKILIVQAAGGSFTKEYTHEFQVLTGAGEDTIVFCSQGHFAQNKEIAKVKAGDKCPICKKTLQSDRGVEVGNIFPLGDKYSKAFNTYFIDRDGKKKPVIMGCYGIGLDRTLATIVEMNHDDKGIIWPGSVAPFGVHLLALISDKKIMEDKIQKVSERLYIDLEKQGVEVLYDDRIKSPGEKFADADLIGIPLRVVVSERTLKENCVEIKKRNEKKTKLIKLKDVKKNLQFDVR